MSGIEDDLMNLYEIGLLHNTLGHLSTEPVEFTVNVDDYSENVKLSRWQSYSVMASSDSNVKATNIDGDLAMVKFYSKDISPSAFPTDNRVSISSFL